MKALTLVILTLICCGPLHGQSVQKMSPEIRTQLNAYYDALERADPEKAIQALTQLIALDPTYQHYYGARASVLENMPGISLDSVLKDLDMAVQLDSGSTKWLTHRLDIRLAAETDVFRIQAIQDMQLLSAQHALTISNYLAYIYYARLCDTTLLPHVYEQAIATAFQQLTSKPDIAANWYQLAQVYASIPERMDAEKQIQLIAALDKAIVLDPAQPDYFVLRGDIHYQFTHNYKQASSDYATASSLSSSPRIYARWAQALLAAQQMDEAKQVVNTGLLLYPGNYTLKSLQKEHGL